MTKQFHFETPTGFVLA